MAVPLSRGLSGASSLTASAHAAAEVERDRRDRALERLRNEEYASQVMPADLMQLVAETMLPPYEAMVWRAYLTDDDAQIGRIVRRHINAVRSEAADARAAKRMEQLQRNEHEGDSPGEITV